MAGLQRDRIGQRPYHEHTGDNICPNMVRGIDYLRDPRLNKVRFGVFGCVCVCVCLGVEMMCVCVLWVLKRGVFGCVWVWWLKRGVLGVC